MMSERSEYSASFTMSARGSAKTVDASSNVTPCFRTFASAFGGSQVKRRQLVYYTSEVDGKRDRMELFSSGRAPVGWNDRAPNKDRAGMLPVHPIWRR